MFSPYLSRSCGKTAKTAEMKPHSRPRVERSEEFFGKKLKQCAIRKRLNKYKDFKVDNYQIIPLEESDENSDEE